MALAAKVEDYCLRHSSGGKCLVVEGKERVCVNCIWYDSYYHDNRGNIAGRMRTTLGWCILREQLRGALRGPCECYETQETKRR